MVYQLPASFFEGTFFFFLFHPRTLEVELDCSLYLADTSASSPGVIMSKTLRSVEDMS